MKLWLPELLWEQRSRRVSAPLGFLLPSKNSLTQLEATILALNTPKPSEAIKDSDYVSIPSCRLWGQPEPRMTARGLLPPGNCESGLFRSRCIVAILPINWRTGGKQLGCWIFCHGVMGFVFKFGSDWTNFDVSTPFLMRRGGLVSVRERCPRWCWVRHPCRLR